MKLDKLVNVIDVESTAWEPAHTQPSNEISEIIEIGIAVVNTHNFTIVKNESIIVKPQKSKVSEFCTQLTTLTQQDVDKGRSFQEAISILKKEYSANNRLFVSWGDYDRKMFERNCQDYQVKYPFGPRHLNLKNTFALLHSLDHELGMDQALEYLKLPLNGTHHRGVDDANNIAQILINTLKKFQSKQLINNKFLFGQRVIVDNEIGIVHAGKTLRNKQGHDVQAIEEPQTPGYVWVFLPTRGYACHFDIKNVKPLPNGQL